jgi:hypothetical protein
MPSRFMPSPSPAMFDDLLMSLPSHRRQAIRDLPSFACLTRELRQLTDAIAAVDLIERALASNAVADPLVVRQARQRERRAFRRCAIVSTAIVANARPDPIDLALALLLIVSAGQPGLQDADAFPWRQMRQVLAPLAEL